MPIPKVDKTPKDHSQKPCHDGRQKQLDRQSQKPSLFKELKIDLEAFPDIDFNRINKIVRLYRIFDSCRNSKGAYTPEQTARLLANPVNDTNNIIPDDNSKTLHDKITSASRAKLDILDSEKVSTVSGWYFQGNDGTCVPWAIANAMRQLGTTIEVGMMTGLLNLASRFGAPDTSLHGTTEFCAGTVIEAIPFTNVEIAPLKTSKSPDQKNLKPEKNFQFSRSKESEIKLILSQFITPEKNISYEDPRISSGVLFERAEAIKAELDAGNSLIAGLSPSMFMIGTKSPLEKRGHEVNIAGYRVRNGKMDLQIVDSSNGIYWTSLEHFNESSRGYSIFAVSVKKPELSFTQKVPLNSFNSKYPLILTSKILPASQVNLIDTKKIEEK